MLWMRRKNTMASKRNRNAAVSIKKELQNSTYIRSANPMRTRAMKVHASCLIVALYE